MTLVIENAWILTFDAANPVIERGAIRIEGDRIVSLAPMEIDGHELPRDAERIDAGGRVVLPGLVVAHHHLYSGLARGFAPSPPPADFSSILSRLWWPLDKALTEEDITLSADVGSLACIAAGVTTVIDHHESQGIQEGILARIAGRTRKAGIRACLCLGASDRFGKGLEGVRTSRDFLASLDPGDRYLRGMVGLHASFTVEDATLEAAADLARERDVGLHAHLAEDPTDNERSVVKFGARPVARFKRAGVLGPLAVLAHGVHLTPGELDALGEAGATL
ncbi:MAG: amidohydrolase family protein, partial [Planctomycetota bacterium]